MILLSFSRRATIAVPRMRLVTKSTSLHYSFIALSLYLLAYLISTQVINFHMSVFIGNYVLPTVVWGLMIAAVSRLPGVPSQGKMRLKRLVCWLALTCVLIALFGMMIQGVISNFGRSPYDRSFMGILINIITIGTAILAAEMTRAWLLNRHFARWPILGISLISLLFGIMSFPIREFARLEPGMPLIKFIGQQLGPTLAQNVLASYLAWLGGPLPAFIYRAGLSALEHFSPILPNNEWVSQSLAGMLAPIFGFALAHSFYDEAASAAGTSAGRDNDLLSWSTGSLAVILIIWFNMGVFSYMPKVIMTGSMEPLIMPGDVVVVHRSKEAINTNDIIMFPANRMQVTHRIVAVNKKDGCRIFTTKGDANPHPDPEPVPENKVKGKVVLVVPKIGIVSQFLRRGLSQALQM